MGYLSTMNLPAPPHARFAEVLSRYDHKPAAALADFERDLKSFFQVEAVATVSNCFTALSIALLFASRGRARTVAISGLAYRRTVDIVRWAGLEPVFVDNSPADLSMSLEDLRRKLESQPIGCIMVQHPMVHIGDVDAYLALGAEAGVPVLFDSVEATGASYKGRRIGGFGLVEGFSLHPSKVVNGAEGGVLTFGQHAHHQDFLAFTTRIGLRRDPSSPLSLFGLEPVHAVMGMASLAFYDEALSKFREQYLRYRENLGTSKILELVEYDPATVPNYKSVLVKLKGALIGRRAPFLAYLETHRIGARPYYAPLHPAVKVEQTPNSKCLADQYAILPIGYSVSLDDIDFIAEKIAAYEATVQGEGDA
jgi:dTDP-4-amino-4,6-dideoxygalactose transaminase